ncbi:hypothetical protein B5M09_010975 [Aphanomyces astaci]|uniref:Uncharacterized protein n=1 Tax=Aphanomyces astaci TaxID=112090 RepID=A0A3R7YGX1_APHAT|nr:hypothetical protein B5M09_010975 [Aphanomyces astaci]
MLSETRHTFEQKVHLHHQQQLHSQQKMEMNNRLMAELEDQRRRQEVLVEQLNAQKKQTKAHEQGLHQAAAASVKHGEQLEEMRRRTSARWHAFSATLVPAIAAPTTSPAVAGIQRASLSACIDPLSVERIAYWEIGKASHELTEEDWKVFFLGAKDCDPVDMFKLDVAMAKLKMDTTVQSAESRVSMLVSDFEAVLVRLSMEGWLADYMRRYGEFGPLMATAAPVNAKSDKLPAATKTPKAGKPPRSWLS